MALRLADLENLYARLNRPEYIVPDPLQWLRDYPAPADREVVGLLAAGLAYGRVASINSSIGLVLAALGPHPARYVLKQPKRNLEQVFSDFKHRWTTGAEVAGLLAGVRQVLNRHGSLENCFLRHYLPDHADVRPALEGWVAELRKPFGPNSLVASPVDGSACKRMMLFLRWMVRADAVDPGGWTSIPPSKLVIPLDVHMFNSCSRMGFTKRKQANLKTALEITEGFRKLNPGDPLKYDFSLTRLGIRSDVSAEAFYKGCGL